MRHPVTICIVDDDDGVRSSLANYLRAAGLYVRAFDSAELFLTSSYSTTADCLITDLHMPDLDGLGLQRELNRMGRRFPVVVMTAFPAMAARRVSSQLGAAAFSKNRSTRTHCLRNLRKSCDSRSTGIW